MLFAMWIKMINTSNITESPGCNWRIFHMVLIFNIQLNRTFKKIHLREKWIHLVDLHHLNMYFLKEFLPLFQRKPSLTTGMWVSELLISPVSSPQRFLQKKHRHLQLKYYGVWGVHCISINTFIIYQYQTLIFFVH